MALPKGIKPLFTSNEQRTRNGAISLTVAKTYVSLSTNACSSLGNPEYVVIGQNEKQPNTLYVYPTQKGAEGALWLYDKQNKKVRKWMRSDMPRELASIFGQDLKKGTFKVIGEHEADDNYLVFDGKNAQHIKHK